MQYCSVPMLPFCHRIVQVRPELKNCLFVLYLPSILELGRQVGKLLYNILLSIESRQKRQHINVLSDTFDKSTIYLDCMIT